MVVSCSSDCVMQKQRSRRILSIVVSFMVILLLLLSCYCHCCSCSCHCCNCPFFRMPPATSALSWLIGIPIVIQQEDSALSSSSSLSLTISELLLLFLHFSMSHDSCCCSCCSMSVAVFLVMVAWLLDVAVSVVVDCCSFSTMRGLVPPPPPPCHPQAQNSYSLSSSMLSLS